MPITSRDIVSDLPEALAALVAIGLFLAAVAGWSGYVEAGIMGPV